MQMKKAEFWLTSADGCAGEPALYQSPVNLWAKSWSISCDSRCGVDAGARASMHGNLPDRQACGQTKEDIKMENSISSPK